MIKIARYMQKYVGIYRVVADYNLATNDYPRIKGGCNDGNLDPSFDDIYIQCANKSRIYHVGGNKLQAYIPSIGRGHNVIKSIYSDVIGEIDDEIKSNYKTIYSKLIDNGIIFNIEETDEEILFKFKANDIEKIIKYMKPKTFGANKSPFAKSNLPHIKYTIPLEDLTLYKEITSSIPQVKVHIYSDINEAFLSELCTKKQAVDDIKSDMKIKGLSGKNYFHSIGVWDEYCKFIKNYLENKLKETE